MDFLIILGILFLCASHRARRNTQIPKYRIYLYFFKNNQINILIVVYI